MMNMDILGKIIVPSTATIRESLRVIDNGAHKTCIVVDRDHRLVGVISDGDIRRHILRNGTLDARVSDIVNSNPVILKAGFSKKKAKDLMQEKMIEVIPVLNDERKVVSVCVWEDLFTSGKKGCAPVEAPVVIMAGGEGTRLHPYTKILPKPLIPVGDKPILEHIMERFAQYQCREFYLTVNYKAAMIRAYLNETNRNFQTHFIEETKPLGTGGSLHMLKGKVKGTFFVSNCDILIEADYAHMYRTHKEKGNRITVVASLKHHVVPYGVISLNEKEQVRAISEKPELTWLINTGMYILEPEVLNDIPANEFFHITDLIKKYLAEGTPVGVYPISEKSWMDMGQFEEMQMMIQRLEGE